MKKIIIAFLAVFALAACNHKEAKAQNQNAELRMYKSTALQSGITTQTSDTLASVETTYFNVPTGKLKQYSTNKYAFYFTIDTLSGVTPVTVSVIAQGSYDGITWFNLSGVANGSDGINCDSLQIASSAQTNVQKKITCMGGTTKAAYNAASGMVLTGNCTPRVFYARLMCVQASGSSQVVISNPYCVPFDNK